MNVKLTGSVFGFMQINNFLDVDSRFAVIPFYDNTTCESEGYEPDEYLSCKCISEKFLSCDDAAYVVAIAESRDAHVREIIKQVEEFAVAEYGADYYAALSFCSNFSREFRVA